MLHTGNTAANINGAVIAGMVTANDTDPNSTVVAIGNGVYGTAAFNPETGEVTYTLNDNAASQMGAGTNQVTDTITYTAMDSNGNTYEKTIEIVVVRQTSGSGQYIADNQVEGELHLVTVETTGDGETGTPEIALSDGDDMLIGMKLMEDMEIDLGGGNNRFTLTVASGNALSGTAVSAGNGNNRIDIQGAGTALTHSSQLTLGDGDNTVSLSGTRAIFDNSGIIVGNGNNTITLNGGMEGFNRGDESFIRTGDGDNEIVITGSAGFYGMSYGQIETGAGDDVIRVKASGQTAVSNYSSINAGDGNNIIEVEGLRGLDTNSSITAGSGDDTITVTGTGGYGMYNSTITTGEGDDYVYVKGSLTNSKVWLGDGDDRLYLDSEGLRNMLAGNSILDGGANTLVDFGRGELGDVLSLGHDLAVAVNGTNALGGITSGNVTGFEALHLDLFDGGADTLDIDQLLSTLSSKGFTGEKAFDSIVITGDQADTLLFTGEWTSSGQNVILDGFDGVTFDRFTVMNGQEVLEIYLQTGIA
ncbi:MAG: hypothetical protein DELT_02423 [Desulfovibrio sp.]